MIIKRLLKKYHTWKFAKSQRYKVFKKGTLLNAFHESKTIFIHIPKTAGMSLLKAIYGDVTREGHRSLYFNRIALKSDKDNYFSFSFVRTPYDRLYAAYKFLEKGGINKLDKIAFETHLEKFKDFEDFVVNGLDKKLIFQITHLIPQSDFLCNTKGQILVDFIGRFENLEEDVKRLSLKLEKEIEVDHLNKNMKELSYTDVYTNEMIEKVKEIYKKDLAIFKYNFK